MRRIHEARFISAVDAVLSGDASSLSGFVAALLGSLLLLALVVPYEAHAANPHVPPSVTGTSCSQCHTPHEAAVGDSILKYAGEGEPAGDLDPVQFCYACHDGSAAVNVKTGASNASFVGASGHSVEAVDGAEADLTNLCADCHDPHADSATRSRLAETTITVMLPDDSTVDRTVDGADNTWCYACHDDQHSWRVSEDRLTRTTAGYNALIMNPSRTENGYPESGTFPGKSVYLSAGLTTHASIPAGSPQDWVMSSREATRVAGDCLWCHSAHRGVNEHDGLIAEFRSSTPEDAAGGTTAGAYAQACFECHGNSSGMVYKTGPVTGTVFDDDYWLNTAGAPDIYSAATAATDHSGHRIVTDTTGIPGAYYETGSPLPCYECHNPHGSKSGNTAMISDSLGGNLDPRGDPVEVRAFCFSCHTTGDTGAGWDSDDNDDGVHDDGVYTTTLADTAGGETVAGIPRTGAQPLQLLDMDGHRAGDTDSCLDCHGDVHNPTGGISAGGMACYGCHQEYEASMDANSTSTKADHGHIVGIEGGASGDTAASYPSGTETVYCLSCHVDHDKFYDGTAAYPEPSGANLRTGIVSQDATDTDHEPGTANGICVSCHTVAVSGVTYAVSGATYSGKAHDYAVQDASKIGYGDSAFRANCTKCHTDPVGLDDPVRQDGQWKITPHFSTTESRLAKALGADLAVDSSSVSVASTEENLCFACHGVSTPTAGLDGYGIQPGGTYMRPSSQAVKAQFDLGFAHGVGNDLWAGRHAAGESQAELVASGKHIECEDCHNPHSAGETLHTVGTNQLPSGSALQGVLGIGYTSALVERGTTWGSTVDRSAPGTFATTLTEATREYEVCLRCHSSANPDVWTWGADWTDVALEFDTGNSSYHPVFGSLNDGTTNTIPKALDPAQMWSSATVAAAPAGAMIFSAVGTQTMYCSDCHSSMADESAAMGPHGSSARRILKGYYPAKSDGTTLYTLDDVAAGTAQDLLCLKCHPMRTGGSWLNNAHDNHGGKGYACTTCHLARPHGGKVSRLIVDAETTPAPYTAGAPQMSSFAKQARNAYQKENCAVACGAGKHDGSLSTENW